MLSGNNARFGEESLIPWSCLPLLFKCPPPIQGPHRCQTQTLICFLFLLAYVYLLHILKFEENIHVKITEFYFYLFYFVIYYYSFLIYNIVLVLPSINVSLPRVYMCSQSEPPSLLPPLPSLWVIPVPQPRAPCILHRAWTGDPFLTWYYTCFNAILPNHPSLSLSHRVQKTALYICVSFAVSHTVLSLPSS